MNHKPFILSGLMVLAFALSTHFGARAYFQARQLEVQVENMTVRTRLMKQQVGELEQKMRLIQRVNDFTGHARDLQLIPEAWARYDVNVQDALTFRELTQMVEQCVHNKDLYFMPVSFHVAVGQAGKAPDAQGRENNAVPADPNDAQPNDLVLSLKGAFFVRH